MRSIHIPWTKSNALLLITIFTLNCFAEIVARLARLDRPALPLAQQILAEDQILVASMHSFPGMENFLRISIGLPAVNQRLLAALARLLV